MLCEDDEASPGISYLIAIKEGIEFDGKGACSYTDRPNQIGGIDATPTVTIDDGRSACSRPSTTVRPSTRFGTSR